MSETASAGLERREADFWDAQASNIGDDVLRDEHVGLDPTSRRRVALLGDLRGKRVLDVGCGTGLWAVYLASLGGDVTAIDVSAASVEVARRRAALCGMALRVRPLHMSALALEFPEASFDVVHGQDILHHLPGAPFAREMARVLAPAGVGVFSENCANNPLLMFARNRLCGRFGIPKWSTDDEYPLTRQKIAEIGAHFRRTSVEFPEFLFLHFLDAKLFAYRKRRVTWACKTIDRAVFRYLPALRRYSYRQVVRFDGPRCRAGG